MTIRSQPLCSAVSMMPSAGWLSRACTVSQLTPCDFAASAACVRIWLAAAVTISSYCSTGLRLPNRAMRASSSEDQASVTVTTTTGTLSALASASPCVSALPPNSEPSVAIRIRLYMAVLHVEMQSRHQDRRSCRLALCNRSIARDQLLRVPGVAYLKRGCQQRRQVYAVCATL